MNYPQTKNPPWRHQIDAWNIAKNKPNFYYAHDMGTGKSKLSIDDVNGFDSPSVLVICPRKVIPNWKKQLRLHSAHPYAVLTLDKKNMTGFKKAMAIKEHMKGCIQANQRPVAVINFESAIVAALGIRRSSQNKYRVKAYGELFNHQWGHLIVDEAHRTKSPGGVTMTLLYHLRKRVDRILYLSGTPMPHSPLDIYAQMKVLAPEVFGTNLGRFKSDYCVLGGFENRQILRWKNLDDLHEKFIQWAHYVHANDALDLPEKMDVVVECELEPKAMKLYQELNNEFIAEVDEGIITVNNALEKLLRLQQLTTGHMVLKGGGEAFIDSSKIETINEIVRDLDPKEPVVIFYLFKQEGARIKALLEKQARIVAEISGAIDEQDRFESGEASVALAQMKSGSEGLDNLKRARYCIYGCTGFSLGIYRQSRRRLWRPGQTRKGIYYHVVAQGTVEMKVRKSHESKAEIINFVLSDIKKSLGKQQVVANPVADMRQFAKTPSMKEAACQ